MNPVFRELQEIAGVLPLTSVQVGCFLGYLVTLLLLTVTEAYHAFSSIPKAINDAEKQEEKDALLSKKVNSQGL
jgi:hypothetical protein